MAQTIKCTALVQFTHYFLGFGIVHGDPKNDDDAAKYPHLPEDGVQFAIDKGWISDQVGDDTERLRLVAVMHAAPAPAPASTDGAAVLPAGTVEQIPGAPLPEGVIAEPGVIKFYKIRHIGGGYYVIDGPDGKGSNAEKIKGKDVAQAAADELDAEYRKTLPPLEPVEGTESEDAPID